MSLNDELSDLFSRFAALMELRGESVFKAIAFSKVSRILADMNFDIRKAFEEGTLEEIEGIGESSRKIIEDYIKNGKSSDYDQVAQTVPPGLIPMLGIPGLGPKTVAMLWKERKITSLDELIKAIEGGKLEGLKGIGGKKIESIKQGIALRQQAGDRLGLGQALPIAESIMKELRDLPAVKKIEIAGSLRRRRETIGDVDIVCGVSELSQGPSVSDVFVKMPGVKRVLGHGPTKSSILTTIGLQVDLRIVPVENFGAALQYFTGSKEHNVKLRGLAQGKGLTLNEWGLYKIEEYDKSKKETAKPPAVAPVASKTEPDIYKKIGLDYIEPEMREDRGEIEAAKNGQLPKLITVADIRGDLHMHTTASDGTASIEEMAEYAAKLGYEYIAITDHSKSQTIAHGLTAERLLKHIKDIRQVSQKIKKIKVLAGCEVDILVDGRMDFEDAILKELDLVIASPHISLKQERQKATDRMLRAIDNRYVHIIGHPTGRLINQREGLPLDMPKLFAAAKAARVALEINSGFPRLDLNDVNSRSAMELGVKLSINTDAHSPGELDNIHYGIGVARRAWVKAGDVINCLGFKQLRDFLQQRR